MSRNKETEEMTSEETVELLEDIKRRVECIDVYIDEEEGEALDFAIKAIKNQDKLLKMCEEVNENNGMMFIHIDDIKLILRGDL